MKLTLNGRGDVVGDGVVLVTMKQLNALGYFPRPVPCTAPHDGLGHVLLKPEGELPRCVCGQPFCEHVFDMGMGG